MSSSRVAAVAFCIGLVVFARDYQERGDAAWMLFDERDARGAGSLYDTDPASGAWVPAQKTTRIDLYGNEVDRAVGDYRVDERGEMFDLHSPETALARLPRPEA